MRENKETHSLRLYRHKTHKTGSHQYERYKNDAVIGGSVAELLFFRLHSKIVGTMLYKFKGRCVHWEKEKRCKRKEEKGEERWIEGTKIATLFQLK